MICLHQMMSFMPSHKAKPQAITSTALGTHAGGFFSHSRMLFPSLLRRGLSTREW